MDIRSARYVSLTSFKRDGQPVHVPVWIAPLPDGRAGFTTGSDSYKVKRITNHPGIVLRPCDMRGRVADDAQSVAATAVVAADGPDDEAVRSAISQKYGIQFRLTELGGTIKRLVGRGAPVVSIVITLD
jgi:hypothetical protein